MSWALIAGGSKGIGIAIAEALAKRKYDVLLVARDIRDLSYAKTDLENRFRIQVEILSCNLSVPESATIISDFCSAKNLDINILCNAAGLGGSKDFPDLPLNDLRTMVRLNLESTVALSQTFIPLLKKNAPSYILNIGSMAGFAPIPIKTVYSSTKSAVLAFSYSLRFLLKKDKISVSCLCPGPVFTKPAIKEETIKQLGWIGRQMAVEPSVVAELAVRGMLKHKMIIVPGRFASLISFFLRTLPSRLLTYIFYSSRK